jgi:hypothetical protein
MLNENVKNTIKEVKDELTPSGVDVNAGTQTPLGINDVLEAVKHLGENRDYVIKSILAVFISTFLEKRDPVWLMIVGNPSSNKTTLVDLLEPLNEVFKLDTMTSNPFSSGQREKEKPKDLLPILDNKCFIIKEYGTLFGRSDEMVKQLISDLVAIYDGDYAKHSPTRGTVRYKVYFSHLGCVTPMSLSSRQRYMSAVGARFLFLRIEPLDEDEKKSSLTKIWAGDIGMNKEEVSKVICSYCLQLKEKLIQDEEITFNDEAKSKLNNLANLTARARGIVISDRTSFKTGEGNTRYHYETTDIQVEEPFRALKQLKKVAKCLAVVNGSNSVGDEELQIVRRIVLSSMPVRRADILKVFEQGQIFTANQAAEKLGKNYRTVKRNFDELVALQILNSNKGPNDLARIYTLRDEFSEIFLAPPVTVEEAATLFGGEIIN